MTLNEHQFKYATIKPPGLTDDQHFVAADKHGVIGSVTYEPPKERLTDVAGEAAGAWPSRAYHSMATLPEQGRMLRSVPAEIESLAVDYDVRGRGIATGLVGLAVQEHQNRFGQGTFPKPSGALSEDSSAFATKLTGQHHAQTWGNGMQDPEDLEYDDYGDPVPVAHNMRPEEEFADTTLGNRDAQFQGARRKAIRQGRPNPIRQVTPPDTGALLGQYRGQPEAPAPAPEGKQLSFLKDKGSQAPQVKKRFLS